jgi:hypothetical protein
MDMRGGMLHELREKEASASLWLSPARFACNGEAEDRDAAQAWHGDWHETRGASACGMCCFRPYRLWMCENVRERDG